MKKSLIKNIENSKITMQKNTYLIFPIINFIAFCILIHIYKSYTEDIPRDLLANSFVTLKYIITILCFLDFIGFPIYFTKLNEKQSKIILISLSSLYIFFYFLEDFTHLISFWLILEVILLLTYAISRLLRKIINKRGGKHGF